MLPPTQRTWGEIEDKAPSCEACNEDPISPTTFHQQKTDILWSKQGRLKRSGQTLPIWNAGGIYPSLPDFLHSLSAGITFHHFSPCSAWCVPAHRVAWSTFLSLPRAPDAGVPWDLPLPLSQWCPRHLSPADNLPIHPGLSWWGECYIPLHLPQWLFSSWQILPRCRIYPSLRWDISLMSCILKCSCQYIKNSQIFKDFFSFNVCV